MARLFLGLVGLMLSGIAQSTPQWYTDQAAFSAALPGISTTVDFDSATADALIPSGSSVDGITFSYALDGTKLKVSTQSSNNYSTTSGSQFLGSDDADIFQDGDTITLLFAPVSAIGLYLISNDALEDNDISLNAGGITASLVATEMQSAPLSDGSSVHFLGIIDAATPFSTATIMTPGNGEFLFNVDDIVTALASDDDGDGILDATDNCINAANGPTIPDSGGNSQRDTDGDGYGNVCDADLSNDGVVNFADLALFRTSFGSNNPDADFNGDGVVNFADLATMRSGFGKPPGPSGVNP